MMQVLVPAAGHGPAVLVAHPWWGLNRTVHDYGAALQRQGFVVGLPDLFDGEVATTVEAAEALADRERDVPPARQLADALDQLRRHRAVSGGTGLGAVGFSFGAFHLLGLVGAADVGLTALVSYYASRPIRLAGTGTAVLAHHAAVDPFDEPEEQAAMRAAIADAGPPSSDFTYPGTRHWFAEADRPEYDAEAASDAFARTVAFLRQGD